MAAPDTWAIEKNIDHRYNLVDRADQFAIGRVEHICRCMVDYWTEELLKPEEEIVSCLRLDLTKRGRILSLHAYVAANDA